MLIRKKKKGAVCSADDLNRNQMSLKIPTPPPPPCNNNSYARSKYVSQINELLLKGNNAKKKSP